MSWWTKTIKFITKYWQWILMVITAIAFYLLGRSKDAKKQQVKFYEKWKDLEEEQREELVDDLVGLAEEKDASLDENVLNFEEKKAKFIEDAKKVKTEEFLKSKGIEREE
tara:strand:- start:880 stop:1209 length:330 start_codon:yes stop_codon:yes gene_type:complete